MARSGSFFLPRRKKRKRFAETRFCASPPLK